MSYFIFASDAKHQTTIESNASNEHDALADLVFELNLVKIDLNSNVVSAIIKTFTTKHLKNVLAMNSIAVKLNKKSDLGYLI